jgi:hypothetical protein
MINIIITFILGILFILWGFSKEGRIYELPFLVGLVVIGWLGPQLIFNYNSFLLPDGALNSYNIMVNLSLILLFLGYVWPKTAIKVFNWSYSENRLVTSSIILSIIGFSAIILISLLPEEFVTGASKLSGPRVALLFFAELLKYGMSMALLVFLYKNNKIAMIIALFSILIFLFYNVLLPGKRGNAAELFFIVTISWWFVNKKTINKYIMLLIPIFAIVFNTNISEYRGAISQSDIISLKNISNINWLKQKNILSKNNKEVQAGAYQVYAAEKENSYDLGAYIWNQFVFTYVPAQIFGSENKNSLYINREIAQDNRNKLTLIYNYTKKPSTTVTGFTDSFVSFWYFGSFVFFLISFVVNSIYISAVQGNIAAQIVYLNIIVSALLIITHNTSSFYTPFPHMVFFILPLLYYSKIKKAINLD